MIQKPYVLVETKNWAKLKWNFNSFKWALKFFSSLSVFGDNRIKKVIFCRLCIFSQRILLSSSADKINLIRSYKPKHHIDSILTAYLYINKFIWIYPFKWVKKHATHIQSPNIDESVSYKMLFAENMYESMRAPQLHFNANFRLIHK